MGGYGGGMGSGEEGGVVVLNEGEGVREGVGEGGESRGNPKVGLKELLRKYVGFFV